MSKASTYAKKIEELRKECPYFENATVTDAGDLNVIAEFSPEDAIEFAKWIIETFSDNLQVTKIIPQTGIRDTTALIDEKWGTIEYGYCAPSAHSEAVNNPTSLLGPTILGSTLGTGRL